MGQRSLTEVVTRPAQTLTGACQADGATQIPWHPMT
jgi:hypothetical protein